VEQLPKEAHFLYPKKCINTPILHRKTTLFKNYSNGAKKEEGDTLFLDYC